MERKRLIHHTTERILELKADNKRRRLVEQEEEKKEASVKKKERRHRQRVYYKKYGTMRNYKNDKTLAKERLASIAISRGDLPHEFLLRIVRGEKIRHDGELITPDMEMRVDAAKAAAPYFAPKLSNVEVVRNMNDDDLQELITGLATECGFNLTLIGEGSTRQRTLGETSEDAGESSTSDRDSFIIDNDTKSSV